jgi:hypothetical protein
MKQATQVALIFGSFYCFTLEASAQTITAAQAQSAVRPAAATFTCGFTLGPLGGPLLSGPTAPYSAVRESSNVQTLSDGTHISHKPSTEKIYRDSQGRTRTERSFCGPAMDDPEAVIITIRDPVSGYDYILDTQNQIAHRYTTEARQPSGAALPTKAAADAANRSVVTRPGTTGPAPSMESLGSQTMEGIYVEGTKTTMIIPAESQDNDRAITVVGEQWYSPELKITILSKTSDPRHGEMMTRLTNIELSQPPLILFQPPPDFKIVDETESVHINYARH